MGAHIPIVMADIYLRKFDWFVLKPLWIGLVLSGIYFLLQTSWLVGVAMLVSAFLVGVVASGLHADRSFSELAAGYPSRNSIKAPVDAPLDLATSLRLARAGLHLAFILAAVASVIALHIGLRWYITVGVVVAIVWLGPMILAIPIMLISRSRSAPHL